MNRRGFLKGTLLTAGTAITTYKLKETEKPIEKNIQTEEIWFTAMAEPKMVTKVIKNNGSPN